MDAGQTTLLERLGQWMTGRWMTTLQRARLTGREQEALRLLDAVEAAPCGRQAQGPRGPWCLYEGEACCEVHCPHRDFDPGEGPIAFG
jgi:hypothetical protein